MGKRNRDVCMKERYKPFNFEEARKNPEMNPHIGAWDYVDKYQYDPDVYISFTEIDKIGLNPQSKYNTPLGIYTYPLKEFAEKYIFGSMSAVDEYNKLHIKNTVGSYAPFAGNAKYINFIRCKDKANFIEDMYPTYIKGLVIDIINNDGNYEPSNCRWVTQKENSNNRRSNKMFRYKNEDHTISQWCDILGIPYQKLQGRLRYMSVDRAVERCLNII